MNAPDSSCVGREREIEALMADLGRVLAGQGRLVMIAGAPGIGKTRTSQAFADIAEQQGAEVLWGRCYDHSGAPPYQPWRQAIRAYAQGTSSDALSSYMGSGVADIAEIVPEIKIRFPELDSRTRPQGCREGVP